MYRNSLKRALVVAMAGTLIATSVAVADNVQNDVVATGTPPSKIVTITAGDATGATVNYRIGETGGDSTDTTGAGAQRCNAADGTSATVTPTGMPAGVSTTPTSVTFTNCSDAKGIVFKATATTTAGDYPIGASVSDSGATTADYNTSPAGFTLRVLAAPAGDTTPPVIGYVLSPDPADGENGWWVSDVTLTWTVTEADSPSSLVKTGCVDQSITADQVMTSYSCSATSDGGSAGPVSVSIGRDATEPMVEVTGFTDGDEFVLGVDTLPTVGCDTDDATSGVQTDATLTSPSILTGVGTFTFSCDGAEDNAGNTQTSAVSASYSVIFNFAGFFQPVDNMPTLNAVKAGSSIPVKFSLDGNQGLNIFVVGSPSSFGITCDATAPVDPMPTSTAGSSGLSYDATTDSYNYVWKTNKAWVGQCRQLNVMLIDDTTHSAWFMFK